MTSKFPKTPALNVSVSHREIPSAPGAGQAVAIARPKDHGTILLVEDTHSLREVTKEFLSLPATPSSRQATEPTPLLSCRKPRRPSNFS